MLQCSKGVLELLSSQPNTGTRCSRVLCFGRLVFAVNGSLVGRFGIGRMILAVDLIARY